MIDIEGLSLHIGGRCLLAIPQLRIEAGERVAVVGPNGAGKSTLLGLIAGRAPAPWQGRVCLLGQALPLHGEALRQLRRRVAVVHQGLHLVGRLSARDNLLIGALARCQGLARWRSAWLGRYPAALEAEADAWLQRLGLEALGDLRADRLSGGERQRTAIGRAALQRPELLLADEATAQLDPRAAPEACAWLREAAGGGTLVSVVHQLELLPRLADRVIGLRDGALVLDHPVDDSAHLRHALAALYQGAPAQAEAVPPRPAPAQWAPA